MPWKETEPMDQRIKLIADWKQSGNYITDLSKKYEVSRKTVYKWTRRYQEEGLDGLKERSRAPRISPNQTKDHIVEILIDEKCIHKSWGPKKIIAFLQRKYPYQRWPAPSTAGEWFKKAGLSVKRKRRIIVPQYTSPFAQCKAPNDVWSADYKGHFKMKNREYCYPLTISDNNTRYLLACEALEGPRYRQTKRVFEATFKKQGLPLAIRTDNGIPFAGKSISGLSRLSVWWIKLGITPERIDKGEPQQNGRHERMHRTLKEEEAVKIPALDLKAQQRKFDFFQTQYNEDRPHEALGQRVPASMYKRSKREYNGKFFHPEYDLDLHVRSVKRSGEIKFKSNLYFTSTLLRRERVGLKEIAEDKWQINFYSHPIGIINLRRKRVEPINNIIKV